MHSKSVLITGADGFTGQYIVQQLKSQDFHVIGLGCVDAINVDKNIICDLTDKESVMAAVSSVKPDWVIHLAAISFVAHADINDIYRVNVLGTRNLLASLAELSKTPDAILLASSANVYGNLTSGTLGETTPLAPVNDYGVSKVSMEYMARLWVDKLPLIITRPFNYTGLGQNKQFLIPKIVDHFIRKAPTIELGNIDIEREFGDVRSVCDIYQQLLEQPLAIGKVINICSGTSYPLKAIINSMEKIAGYKIKVKINPEFVRDNEIKRLAGSNDLLHSMIGQQQYPEIEDTLSWMYAEQLN